MCVTMSVMLSSDVRTSVGPNTRARFLGSIWTADTALNNSSYSTQLKVQTLSLMTHMVDSKLSYELDHLGLKHDVVLLPPCDWQDNIWPIYATQTLEMKSALSDQ